MMKNKLIKGEKNCKSLFYAGNKDLSLSLNSPNEAVSELDLASLSCDSSVDTFETYHIAIAIKHLGIYSVTEDIPMTDKT